MTLRPNDRGQARSLITRYLAQLAQGRPLWLVWVMGTAVLFARRPDAFFLPQFWAEDGMFFQTDYIWGWPAIAHSYNGYHHLIPRLVAAAAGRLDPLVIPVIFFLCALGLTLYVATLTLSARFPFPRNIGFALAVVLVPDAFEVLLNVANAQWILAAGFSVLLVLRDPASAGQKVHDTVAAILLGLTGPFSVLLCPLFAFRAWRRRTAWSMALAVIVGGTATIQLMSILRSPTPFPADGAILYGHGLAALGLRTGGSLMMGSWIPYPPPLVLGWILASLTVLAGGWLTWRPGENREARIMLALAATLILIGGLYRYRGSLEHLLGTIIGARYFFGAQLTLLWLTLPLVSSGRRRLVLAGSGALVLFLAANVTRLREPAFADQQWRDYVAPIRAGEPVVIPTNPPGSTFALPPKPRAAAETE